MAVKRASRRRAAGWLALLLPMGIVAAAAALLVRSAAFAGQAASHAGGSSAASASRAVSALSSSTRSSSSSSSSHAAPKDVQRRCEGTVGTWCVDYLTQQPVPAKPAPRGNKTCSLDCNLVGVCNALSGLCTCPAGWTSFNCLHPMLRHCTAKWQEHGFERGRQPPSWGGPADGTDPRAHCAGECDERIAACYCPSNTTYGRVPAPIEAPQGSPPRQQGRPMNGVCQPKGSFGGTVEWEDLFGPQGWCQAAQPKKMCECNVPGWGGPHCDQPVEQFCLNQCNGRGECLEGYCKCHPGWHGIDCAHAAAVADTSAPGLEQQRPWIQPHIHTPAALPLAANATRTRPLIYVYELPADYATLVLQYRHVDGALSECVPRYFNADNSSAISSWLYKMEVGFLEALLQSGHRTLDPEEADFFYAPVFTSCFIYPVRDGADSLRDTWYYIGHRRTQGAANMLLEAFHYLRAHFPYWDRRGGRDHVFLVTHDEASCWVPAPLRPAIILSHWGRLDANHTSESGYWLDFWSDNVTHPQFEPKGFLSKLGNYPCHDPTKDLVVPSMKTPDDWRASPLAGAPTRNRTWLAFHRGRVQAQNLVYSRGVRQRVANASRDSQWLQRHRIAVGEGGTDEAAEGDYSELLASSLFCLVLQGDGWTARFEDAVLHGCIPLVIMDQVAQPFEALLDTAAFSLRVPPADIERLPEILQAVPAARVQAMQRALARVWHRYSYSSYRPYSRRIRQLQAERARERGGAAAPQLSLPPTVPDLDPEADDAFHTIMAWLASRIEATR